MRRFKVTYDWVLYILLMVALLLPILQEHTNLFPTKPLNGVFVPTPKPTPSFETYRNNTYQPTLEKYISENFGFRAPVIRLYNQFLWDGFHKTQISEDQMVRGKKGWLYEPGSVSNYYQRQFYFFAPDATTMSTMLTKEAQRLLMLQNTLETFGTHLLVCQVPSKDLVYPEYLPEDADTSYVGAPKMSARFFNEEIYNQLGINHLNLEQWFLQIKDTADFMLFPKTGMHWSNYASLLAADTLIRYMEHLGSINMRNLVIGPRVLDNARQPDDDLERLLNLWRPISKPQYDYAECTSDGDTTAIKPKVIVIGDSFWWSIAAQLELKDFFSVAPYWYYNNTIYYDPRYNAVKEVNIADELCSADFVVLSYSATQQYRMNDGFTLKALEALGVEGAVMDSAAFIERETQHAIADLIANPESMKLIREKAARYKKTVEKTVRDDASWIVNYKIEQGMIKFAVTQEKNMGQLVKDMKERLRQNPDMVTFIQEKADKNGRTFEEQLDADARWIVNNQKKD